MTPRHLVDRDPVVVCEVGRVGDDDGDDEADKAVVQQTQTPFRPESYEHILGREEEAADRVPRARGRYFCRCISFYEEDDSLSLGLIVTHTHSVENGSRKRQATTTTTATMALVIPIDECLSDSPRFRAQLAAHENNLDDLEQRLEKVLKLSGGVGETGRAHVAAQTQFLSSLWELSAYFGLEQQPGSAGAALAHINRMIQTVHEVVKLENAAFDAAAKGMQRVIEQFLREDVKQMRDTKGYFNKISGDLDSALAKNAAASKGRPGDVDDASNVLTATRSCFRYTTLDYVYQISMLQSKKAHEALEALQKHYDAYADFFGRGAALFDGDECAEQTAALRADIADLRAGSKALEKNLERRHTHVSQNEVEVMEQRRMARGNGNNGSVEGYLFKRGQNAFRTWNRRWFYLQVSNIGIPVRTIRVRN